MLGTSSKLELVLECEEMLLGAYRRADLVLSRGPCKRSLRPILSSSSSSASSAAAPASSASSPYASVSSSPGAPTVAVVVSVLRP